MKTWQLQTAKARLSELVRQADKDGPQLITSNNREVAVVVSPAEYERLTHGNQSLLDFVKASPLFATDFEISRDRSLPRDIAFFEDVEA